MLNRFFAYYAPWRGLFFLDFGCAVVAGLLELAFPVAVKLFVDELLPTAQWGWIVGGSLALLAIYVVNAGLMAVVTYWGHMLGINIETRMREEAFRHLQSLSFGFFDNQKTGHLVGRLTKDLEEIGEVAHHGPEDLFIAVMTFLGAFALMMWIHVELAVLTAVIVPLGTWVTVRYGNRMTRTWHAIYARVGDFNSRIEENVGGIRVVKSFANEAHEQALFARSNEGYRSSKLDAYRIMAFSQTLNYLSMRLTQIVVMVAGTYFVLSGSLTAGGFVGFLLLVNVFFRPVEKIASVIETYPKGIAGFRRFTEFLDTAPDIADSADARDVVPNGGTVEFRDLRFSYGGARPVIDGIDLSVRAGETVAFVGPSGAGKTTLLSLVPRFYDATSGQVLVDGADVRELRLESLRRHVGVVGQEAFLFGGTVRENVAYGRLGASDAEVRRALERAHLWATVEAMPEGLDTVVGERGVKLSGGQKQRMSIARMFLKDPEILILDEATSALDAETERAIQLSLAELSRGRTTLVIAHRLSTIRHADRIVVLDGGRIAESGTHRELILSDGAYARLVRASAFAADETAPAEAPVPAPA